MHFHQTGVYQHIRIQTTALTFEANMIRKRDMVFTLVSLQRKRREHDCWLTSSLVTAVTTVDAINKARTALFWESSVCL